MGDGGQLFFMALATLIVAWILFNEDGVVLKYLFIQRFSIFVYLGIINPQNTYEFRHKILVFKRPQTF
jgi:hypothetical protein